MGVLRGKELSKRHLVKHGFVAGLGRDRHRLRLGLLIADFGAPWARVSVGKLGILANAKFVGVTIERGARS